MVNLERHVKSLASENERLSQKIKQQFGVQASIYDAVPMMMFSVNRHGRAITVNSVTAEKAGKNKLEMLGLLYGELIGCTNSVERDSCGQRFACEDCVLRQAIYETFESGGPVCKKEGILTLRADDGPCKRTYIVTTSPVRVEEEDTVLVSLDDITDVKGAKEFERQSSALEKMVEDLSLELRRVHQRLERETEEHESEEENVSSLLRFHTATMETPGVWVSAIDGDAKVTIWNRAAEMISGYTLGEVAQKNEIWSQLFPDPVYRSQILAWAKNGHGGSREPRGIQATMRCKDGRLRAVSWHAGCLFDGEGDRAGSVLLGVEVTDTAHVVDDSMLDGLYFIDFPEPISVDLPKDQQVERILEGRVFECNDVIARFQGAAQADDVIGMTLGQLLSCQQSQDTAAFVGEWVESGYRIRGVVSSPFDATGKTRILTNSVVGVLEKGKLIRLWGTQSEMYKTDECDDREPGVAAHELKRALDLGQLGYFRLLLSDNAPTWSEESYRLLGIPAEPPLCYRTFLAAVHPEDRKLVHSQWKKFRQGQPFHFVHRIIVNGAVRWIEEQSLLEFDEQNRPVSAFGVLQDITRRKCREIRHERVSLAVEHSPAAFDIVDQDGRFVYVNPAYAEMFGFDTVDDLLGAKQEEFIGQAGIGAHSETLSDDGVSNRDGLLTREVRGRRRDGSQLSLLRCTRRSTDPSFGTVYQSISVQLSQLPWSQEMERRDSAVAAPDDSTRAQRDQSSLDASPVAHLSVELSGGTIRECNPAAGKLLGFSKKELSGRSVGDFVVESGDGAGERSVLCRLFAGETIAGEEIRLRSRDRLERDALLSCYPVTDGQGKIIESHLEAVEISERKQSEKVSSACLRLLETAVRTGGGAKELPETLLKEAVTLTGSRIGFYHCFEGGQRTHSTYLGPEPAPSTASRTGFWGDSPPSTGLEPEPWVVCLVDNRPVIRNSDDVNEDQDTGDRACAIVRELVVPLVHDGQMRAILGVGNKTSDYGSGDLEAVDRLLRTGWDTMCRLGALESRGRVVR